MTRYVYSGISEAGERDFSACVITFLIFIFVTSYFLIFSSSFAAAQDYQQAYTAVENLASEIRTNEGAVGQVLMEAMQSNHGDLQKWHALDEKMGALGQSIDRNLPEIGRNLAILRAAEPNRSPPYVTLGRTFEGNLNMAKNKKKELLDLAKSENEKLNKINQMIAKVDKELLNVSRGLMSDTIEGFIPTEISLAGEASVIVLGAYFGPVGIVAAGTAWAVAGAFNSLVNLYYNTKAAADQTKVLAEMKQGLQARKAELDKNLSTLMEGARETEQIEKILEKHENKMSEYKARISAAMGGWNEQQKKAFEEKKKKIEEKIKEAMSQPKYGGKWTLCNGTVISLDPSEYASEVSSMLSQLESYTRAVEDGGDPDNFQAMVADWHNKLYDQYKLKSEDYKIKSAAWGSASNTCYQSYIACMNSARTHDQWLACYPRYCGCIMPSSAALANANKELSRINSIHYSIKNVYYFFRERIEVATRSKTSEFWNTYTLWQNKFGEANSKAYEAISDVPYWVDHWKERAAKLDEEIQYSLRWGSSIADIRNGLLATAVQLKELDKTVKGSAKKYEEVNLERIRIANQAQNELTSLLNKWGRLIGYYWGVGFPWLGEKAEFTPRARELELNVSSLSERIRALFTVQEPEHLKRAKTIDFTGIAALYENKANELTFYTDWAETYRHRLSSAAGALNRISWEKTDRGFYADRGGNAREVLNMEFSKPSWSTIASDAGKYVSKEDYASLPWARFQSWDTLGIWQKLYAGQTMLLDKLNKAAPHYVSAMSSGWFQPVPPDIIVPLQDNWKKLREVCERYDALAKPERDKIGDGLEKAQKEVQLLLETWGKMPEYSRNLVQDEHRRFSNAYSWLREYFWAKADALRPSLLPPTNDTAIQLDNLILGYAPAYEKWRKQQEEQTRQWEEAEKVRLEEERKKAEEDRKKAEEERKKAEEEKNKVAANLALVQDLYSRFKKAYESRNDSQVMSFISDSWEAGDGTTLADLQMNLSRSFRVFDEIRYDIQNLKIDTMLDGRYSVGYDVTITSRIHRRNIRHEEKSSVREEVVTDDSGKVKIFRTSAGRFWQTQ